MNAFDKHDIEANDKETFRSDSNTTKTVKHSRHYDIILMIIYY